MALSTPLAPEKPFPASSCPYVCGCGQPPPRRPLHNAEFEEQEKTLDHNGPIRVLFLSQGGKLLVVAMPIQRCQARATVSAHSHGLWELVLLSIVTSTCESLSHKMGRCVTQLHRQGRMITQGDARRGKSDAWRKRTQ